MKNPLNRNQSPWHSDLETARRTRDALANIINNNGETELHTTIDHGAIIGRLTLVDDKYLKRHSNPMGPFEGHTVKVLPAPDTPQTRFGTGTSS